MKIESKLSWKFYVLPTLLLLINIGFAFLFFKTISSPEKVPFGVLVIPTVFLSISFPLFVMIVRSIKNIIIEDEEIRVKFLFGKTYEFDSLLGYNELIDTDKFGEYKTFYFKTNSKIFKFGNREFKNYDEITQKIVNKTHPIEISIFFEMKMLLIVLLITLGILLTIIWIGNQ